MVLREGLKQAAIKGNPPRHRCVDIVEMKIMMV